MTAKSRPGGSGRVPLVFQTWSFKEILAVVLTVHPTRKTLAQVIYAATDAHILLRLEAALVRNRATLRYEGAPSQLFHCQEAAFQHPQPYHTMPVCAMHMMVQSKER